MQVHKKQTHVEQAETLNFLMVDSGNKREDEIGKEQNEVRTK